MCCVFFFRENTELCSNVFYITLKKLEDSLNIRTDFLKNVPNSAILIAVSAYLKKKKVF